MFKKRGLITMGLGFVIFALECIRDGREQSEQEENTRKITREEIEAYFAEQNEEEEA